MQNLNVRKNELGWWFLAGLIGLFIIALCVVAGVFYAASHEVEKYKALGPWADFVSGTLTPVLTFFTFTGVLLTVVLQKIALNMTHEDMRNSADALEKQSRNQEKQSFEATFFQMLTLHNTIVNSIDLVNSETGARKQGRDCFQIFYTRLNKIYRAKQKKHSGTWSDEKILALSYRIFWRGAQLELGHYYRYLYNVIRFVKNSSYSDGYYIKLLRAQLSDQELLLLFYNCLSEQGAKFMPFAEEFALFDNMPIIRLLGPLHKNRMLPAAFGQN